MARRNIDASPDIRRMVGRIVKGFKPVKIILFGSHARGGASPDSDVDLLVVMAVPGSKRETEIEIRVALNDIPVAKDIIVTTPDDFEWRKEIPGTIERPAALEGKVLYARPCLPRVLRRRRLGKTEMTPGRAP